MMDVCGHCWLDAHSAGETALRRLARGKMQLEDIEEAWHNARPTGMHKRVHVRAITSHAESITNHIDVIHMLLCN